MQLLLDQMKRYCMNNGIILYKNFIKTGGKSLSGQQSIPDSRLNLTNILFLALETVALELVLKFL